MSEKIGLPRGLLFYKYEDLVVPYFDELGCEVVVSPETNKGILKKGIDRSIDESCLSVKIFLGHVDALIGKADYIFVPRVACLRHREEMCTKFLGLPDIIRNTFDDVKLLECDVDMNSNKHQMMEFIKMGVRLGNNPIKCFRAYTRARKNYQSKVYEKAVKQAKLLDIDGIKILVVSHPYTTYDAFLGKPITKYLKSQGVVLLYSDSTGYDFRQKEKPGLSETIYWTFHKEFLAAIEKYRKDVQGILFLSTFPCGPDSLVIDLCQKKIKEIPVVVITLDEQQGDAGLKTRLESFVDILKIKNENKSKLPAYGQLLGSY